MNSHLVQSYHKLTFWLNEMPNQKNTKTTDLKVIQSDFCNFLLAYDLQKTIKSIYHAGEVSGIRYTSFTISIYTRYDR